MTIGMYIIAILPAMLLIAGVYCFGHKSRIPIKHILVVSAVGTLTIPLSWLFSTLTQTFSWYPTVINTLADGILTALLDAALPEELAKWLMLLLVLFYSKHYSNRYAAIVYAVCISMSFASLENVWYLGKDMPVMASAGGAESGTAYTDGNRYTITLQDNSMDYPYEVKTAPSSGSDTNYVNLDSISA